MMLNAFLLRKQATADRARNLDEIGKVKRDVIVEYCQKFNHRMSHYALRGQIMAYCNSLRALLNHFPTFRDTFFMLGQPQEKKGLRDSKEGLEADPREKGSKMMVSDHLGTYETVETGDASELQELQNMIDSLQSPQDPTQVSQALLLRREVMFLQFDAAVRYLIRITVLRRYNTTYKGDVYVESALGGRSEEEGQEQLDNEAFVLFPWRAFLEDGGPFPLMSSSPDTLEYNMQLCLCRLSDRDLKVAHGELVGMQLLMEDVLLSNYHVIMEGSPGQQVTLDKNIQPDLSGVPGFRSQFQSSPKASELLGGPCNAVMSLALLRSFLVLWKQLEVLKEHWGRLKLRSQDINSLSFHKQFLELYRTDILYPSMKAIARRMGKEDEFEELIISSQSILPPRGSSEIEIKTQQLQKLLENLEIHMIQEVLRKVNRERALVVSEKSKERHTLPTDLWKHQVMKENFSVIRPQIVEKFIQRLLENYQDGGVEVCIEN
ncbi:Coiled-coil domain-containing protein 162 [Camelus dromedarius]|uniref:Coiled-coil domain-containing protein 162 n=1 Tax=Camelus dromedarius TaxID=9838 RepID=A0A5N4DX11_CAMDR|nr:Coiled-coil domain-containing protein 162 [Camelus dromedarius]